MRFFLLLQFFLGVVHFASGQKVSITVESRDVEGIKRQGMTGLLEYDRRTVEKAWNKLLKTYGKPDSWRSGALVLLSENNTSQFLNQYDWVSRIDATAAGTKLFWSLGLKGDYAEPGSADFEKAKAMLQDFARQLYREDLSEQIAAAERVVEIASRTHDKTEQIGEQLKKHLERNAADQQQLVKEQEAKRQEAERLKKEIQQNKLDQEAALEEIRKVRKVAEEKKAKLGQN